MVVKRPQNATERLILALDVDTLEEAKSLVDILKWVCNCTPHAVTILLK